MAASAWLASVETVLVLLDPVTAVGAGADRDDRLAWLVEHRGTALNATLLATVVVRVATTLCAYFLANLWLDTVPAALAAGVVVVVAGIVLAEVGPRTRAQRDPIAAGRRRARGARRLVRALAPIAGVLVALGRVRASGDQGPYPDDEEMEGDEPEPFEDDERAMIRAIFELSNTMVREIMVPRPDMVTVEADTTFDELVALLIDCGKSRVPVYREDREHVIGIIYAKDVLERLASGRRRRWIDLLRPAAFVPETKPVDDLLEELQAASVHIAMVVDEYGATTGLVTIEDILEEIVGEIVDEHDDETPLVEVVDERSLRIDARLPVDDLAEQLGTNLPDDDWDTVGGLVVAAFGRVPSPGERVEVDDIEFHVETVTGRRVARVLAVRREPAAQDDTVTEGVRA
nr:hemolysin family protein [Salsipaludibacter albus]